MHKSIKLKNLRPNPFRDLSTYRLQHERVQQLVQAMQETGLWSNMQARPHPTERGIYEITAGHHRLAAALETFGEDYEVEVEIGKYGDLQMLRMMAHENSAGYRNMPGHVVLCTEQALALLNSKLVEFETLGCETKAKTRQGKGAAKKRTVIDDPMSDLSLMRQLFNENEGAYQKARKAGTVGRNTVCRFLDQSLTAREVQAALKSIEVSKRIGVPAAELIDGTENLSQMERQLKVIAAAKTANQARKIVKKVNDTIRERENNGQRGTGRRARQIETAKALQEVAREENDASLLSTGVQEEMGAYMQEVPSELRASSNRLMRFANAASKAQVKSVTDVRFFGNLWDPIIHTLYSIRAVVRQMGSGLTDTQYQKMLDAIGSLYETLEKSREDKVKPQRKGITLDQ
jgi:hypothetical protein